MAIFYLLCSIIIINIHHTDSTEPPPPWLRTIVKGLSRCLYIGRKKFMGPREIKPEPASEDLLNEATMKKSKAPLDKEVSTNNKGKLSEECLLLLQLFCNKENGKEENIRIRGEWQEAARVLNRSVFIVALFLYVLFLAIFILSIHDKI